MTKRQTRLFFFVATGLFTAIFIALTIQTHREVPKLTHQDQMSAQVVAGEHVWHEKDCTNCHTLLGEGAYYAPDLTKIAQLRGPAYLRQFLADPSRFYSEKHDRRLMPNLRLSDAQITDLIAFLTWISHIDTNGWPPRPILVSGAAVPAANLGGGVSAAASNDPVELGRVLFNSSPPSCSGCHSTTPGVKLVGPSLAGVSERAAKTIANPDYHGTAKTAEQYIRESILNPNAYLVPGKTFSANGTSLMPPDFAKTLTPKQVDDLVAYLGSLR